MLKRARVRLLCAALVAAPLAALPSYAAPGADDGTTSVAVPETVRIDEPAHGRKAVRELGEDLDVAAAHNGMTADELRDVLLTDRTAWVDKTGKVFYVEPVADPADVGGDLPVVDSIDPADAFVLHSKPGSQHVLFLDFDGTLVSGTAWNANYGVSATIHPAWTLDGDSTTFSTTERNAVASIWARVAEDYAPFDVDVTTQDPGAAAISRTDSGDPTFGTRVLVSPSADAHSKICPSGCGGVAYIDVFDMAGSSHDYYQPAWVFPQSLGNSSKNIAEAASHEAGHNFALNHDGTASLSYYTGHAMWAPIMGVGYNRPLVQWSKGDYAGASNTTQDDVAIIASNGAPYRGDEAGGTVGTAATATAATTYITTRTDVDVWSLGTCAGSVTLAADPAATSPNLDIGLTLLNAAGGTVATADPPSAVSSTDVATGLNASISTSLASASYFLKVDGVGNGAWADSTGYDDYGSVGAYTITSTGCTTGGGNPVAPGQPTALGVMPAQNGQSATFSWSPPFSDGGSPVTGYVVQRSGASAQNVGSTTTSLQFTGLTPGASYTFTVSAVNAIGTGTPASATQVMPVPTSEPTVPQDLTIDLDEAALSALVSWSPPASDGGSSLLGYELLVDGTPVTTNGLDTSVQLTGLEHSRTYGVSLRAFNAVGYSPAASAEVTTPAPPPPPVTAPSAPRIGAATSGKKGGRSTARIAWSAPLSTGGATITGYVVYAFRIEGGAYTNTYTSSALPASTRRLVFKLPKGRYKFAVAARNYVGWSPQSARSATVKAR